MNENNTEMHRDSDAVRAGSTPHVVRWILGISLLAVIIALSAIWIFGAATHGPTEETVGTQMQDGSAVGQLDDNITEGSDEFEAVDPDAPDTPLQTIENEG
ncbi:hypothetical protein FHS61_001391 [Altererythrobacter atlanticus]|uniref:Uncharacterized protein n=1 Tax=Croceibacterium atlanticum TaxID=1267766 RepID=A0A0F7KUP4_9SPHN|nr:hypothetical protein [Croceibacterium atlanticum]AKH44073.1 hypothetical protein WYH_03053 [Croceibacterium atlanticum]MBB5732382.1 hypothetical protein [Croceibacterium atlanticum]